LYVPEIVTEVVVPTATVVTLNVALVAPAATVTLAGTAATDVLLLLSVTTAPPVGAALLNVTVPVEELPPVTLVGFRLTPERAAPGAVTVRFAEAVPLYVPEMLTEVVVPTATVVTVNVALVAPAATVTFAGTVATDVLLLESVTTAPPVGAALFSVTVPVEVAPPVTDAGLTLSEEIAGGFTVTTNVSVVLLLSVAEIVTCVAAATALVLTVNVALVAPAATVTLAGTVATEVLLLLKVTTAPPIGAELFSVTVPVEVVPPVTVAGLTLTDDKPTGGFTVNVAVPELPPLSVAVIVTGVDALTALVLTVNAALVDPAAIVTLAGTIAVAVLLLESVTVEPPAGATVFNVTVPVDAFPPITAAGFKLRFTPA
jgi:hypothetical protein